MSGTHVKANPYPWPYSGKLQPSNTVMIVIDMQTDFCGRGGYVEGSLERLLSLRQGRPLELDGKCCPDIARSRREKRSDVFIREQVHRDRQRAQDAHQIFD